MSLQNESRVVVVDNTGIKEALIFKVLKGNSKKATIGDIVVLAVKSVMPSSNFKKGDVVRGVVVRTRKEIRRSDGTYIRFGDNAVAIVNKSTEPVGKRIFGPVAKELREKGLKVIANLAEEIL